MAGKVLGGRYTVQDKIGTGGMAIVYRGLDEVLGRTVAIKTMLPQYASDPSFAARFKQEAQAAAALQSPYIVSVYDWGADGDTYYIVMEYLRGTDLKSGIRRHGALDPQKVAQIGSQIAQALSVAHRHDIIHRDIKPQNIMVQPDGNIKVMDFGIARAKNSHLTQDNSVLGTAHYVSPEQTQGKELGATTDIYSLGIVMYEAATGRVPFDGEDSITVALKQLNEQPVPPSQVNPKIDPQLEGIILKCMQKNPAARFQSAEELSRVLRDYLAGRMQAVTNATAVLGVPAGATTKLSGNTATAMMPSVERGMDGGTRRNKPTTASERAAMEAADAERRHRRNTILGVVGAIAAVALIAFIVVRVVGAGGETREVPNLLNLTQEAALKAIDSTDFFKRGDVTEEYSNLVAAGLVIDQDPDPTRKASRGTRINLHISKGAEPAATVTVPDLTGMTPTEADAALTKVGLIGKSGDSIFSGTVEVGHVAQQSPAGKTTASAGDTVTYQLSKGHESVEVPSVVGESEADARSELEAAGFVVTVTSAESDSVSSGYVIRQSLTGAANKGSEVTITVSTGSSSVSIPYVVGYWESSARSMLENAGFDVNVTYATGTGSTAGVVVNQTPTGSARKGATVKLTVSADSSNSSNGSGDSSTGEESSSSSSSTTTNSTGSESTSTSS